MQELAEGEHQVEYTDPYVGDPIRDPALITRSNKPYNAETPRPLLGDSLFTPNDMFYVRNHLPVPAVTPETYLLEVKGE